MMLHRRFSQLAVGLLALSSVRAQEPSLLDEDRKLSVPHTDDAYMKYHSDDYHYYVKAPKAPKAKGGGSGKGKGKGALGDTTMGELLAEIADDEGLTILLELVECADLTDLLDHTYGITLFAPNDDAFDGVSVDFLCSDEGLPSLTNILAYHIVPHIIPASSIGHEDYYKTLQGEFVILSNKETGITVNDANVVSGDIKAKNGIIHVIDGVLFPQGPGGKGKGKGSGAKAPKAPKAPKAKGKGVADGKGAAGKGTDSGGKGVADGKGTPSGGKGSTAKAPKAPKAKGKGVPDGKGASDGGKGVEGGKGSAAKAPKAPKAKGKGVDTGKGGAPATPKPTPAPVPKPTPHPTEAKDPDAKGKGASAKGKGKGASAKAKGAKIAKVKSPKTPKAKGKGISSAKGKGGDRL